MAPKKAGKEAAEAPKEEDTGPPFPFPKFDEAALAELNLGGSSAPVKGKGNVEAEPEAYEDEAGTLLPAPLAAAVADWKRPVDFIDGVGGEEGVELVVVSADVDGRKLPCDRPAWDQPPLLQAVALPTGAAAEDAEATRALMWVQSCLQLVALQAEHLDESTYLWELIYPKSPESGLPVYSKNGKYAVRLFEQGCWRTVVVDDRVPFGAGGQPLVPLSADARQLWPLILAKALYRLSASAPGSISQSPAVLLRLTGWLPECIPVSPELPEGTAWEVLSSRLHSACSLALMLPPSADADEGLAAVALARGPLIAVRDARDVGGGRYVCLESELLQWGGPFRDTDEASWTNELADALQWKRLQRLRIRGAGYPLHDFWMRQDSLDAHFGAILVLHHTAARPEVATHAGVTTADGAYGGAALLVAPMAPPPEPAGEGRGRARARARGRAKARARAR